MNPPSFTTEALLKHSSALRRLARSLIADAAGADDLLQGTIAKALERAPSSPANLRAWLSRVMRNAAHEERRRGLRREDRERAVARDEAGASGVELVERLDSRSSVTRAVRELDEPYRETILLRFFEDLPPRRIAVRLGVPVKTVDSRLHRGLEQLRHRLDEEHGGDRAAWCVMLLPLARDGAFNTFLAGALLMNAKVLGSVAVAVIGAIVYFVMRVDAVAVMPAATGWNPAELRSDVESSEPRPLKPLLASSPEATREEQPAEAAETPPVATPEVEGRVFFVSGDPAAGVQLEWSARGDSGRSGTVVSDTEGRFIVPADPQVKQVACVDEDFISVLEFEDRGELGPSSVMVVVVAPIGRVAGTVLDDGRAPVSEAHVELVLPESFRARVPFDLRSTRPRAWVTPSNAEGRFDFELAPRVPGLRCRARLAGLEEATVDLEQIDRERVELIMHRPSTVGVLEGRVVDALSQPIKGARVGLGLFPAMSDAEGRFRIEFDASAPPERIMAVVPAKLPAVIERGPDGWPPFVELRVDREPLSIGGVVLGVDDQPLAGAKVWIDEPTVFASWSGSFWVAENVIRQSTALQNKVVCDAQGRFEIESLVDREYGLLAMDGPRAWQIEAGRFPAGAQDVEIRFPADDLHPRLEGRVVDSSGLPVAGVTVTVVSRMLAARDPSGLAYYNAQTGSRTTTDAQGAFVLDDVPMSRATLEVYSSRTIFERKVEIPNSAAEPLVIEVARRCELRLDRPTGAEIADCFSLLDSEGEPIHLLREEVGRFTYLERVPLADGRSEILTAPDNAMVLVFFDKEGEELHRMDVRLDPGELNVIQ